MTWEKSVTGTYYLTINKENYQYDGVIGKSDWGYDLTINFRKPRGKTDFYSLVRCKTVSQAKQLEAYIRLAIMEIYL